MQELNISLNYLNQAEKIARPDLKPRIKNLIDKIKALMLLTESNKKSWINDRLINSLDQAIRSITNAESIATPPIRLKLKLIEQDIYQLKLDMQKTNIKNRYDSIITEFTRVIKSI